MSPNGLRKLRRDLNKAASLVERVIDHFAAKEVEVAWLKGENNHLMLQRDRLDCSVREGNGTYHCPVDNPCAACVMRGEIARLKELIAESAPLAWVANQDMDGAQEWERRAAMELGGITDQDTAETAYPLPE
jgi:hypothetical protein